MTSKKEEPIMKIINYMNYLNSTITEQFEILNMLSDVNKKRIGVWLKTVEVIKDINGEPYILSPLCKNQREYTKKDLSYLVFYKWCVDYKRVHKDFDYAKLPKPLDEIFYYAYIWKQNPRIDPYRNVNIMISLNPSSEYVSLYKQIMGELISKFLLKKKIKRLSVEECRKIRDSLPDDHAYGWQRFNTEEKKRYYDYLFIVYFIKSKTIKYDIAFQRDLTIYLDLALYDMCPFIFEEDVSSTSEEYTANLLYVDKSKVVDAYTSNNDSEISISSLAKRLCIDISNILTYMREPRIKISRDTIDKAHFNMNVVNYCKSILPFEDVKYKYGVVSIQIKEKLISELENNKIKITSDHKYDDIYHTIMLELQYSQVPVASIFNTFILIYNTIVNLYSSRNTYIKDNYDEPQILPKERAKSDGIIRKSSVSSVYFVKPKAFSEGDKKSSSPYREVVGYYNNDRDPYTLEDFNEMHLKKQKYVSDIAYDNNGTVFHYRFDTVNLYNYILQCIEKCIKPKNLNTNTDLTDANLDEVCKKIKHFTIKPTYDSSIEIKKKINDCRKYDNGLRVYSQSDINNERKEKDIIGRQYIEIYIVLGNLIFECFGYDNYILILPKFSNKPAFADYNKLTKDIYNTIRAKISVGELICNKFFPYRRNEKITNLPDFTFGLDDDANEIFEKLKIYKEIVERL